MFTFGRLGYDIYTTSGHYYREKDLKKLLDEEWDTPEKLRPVTLDLILELNTTITNVFFFLEMNKEIIYFLLLSVVYS